VLQEWKAEKEWLEQELRRVSQEVTETGANKALDHEDRLIAFQRRWFLRFEDVLHRAEHGPTWLKDERIAELIAASLRHRDSKVYRLDAYCIMSNHVHAVFKPFLDERSLRVRNDVEKLSFQSDDPPLSVIMQSLKSYTANEANKLLKRSGAFWEAESYDHVIKDEEEYYRVIAYVLNNPVKAGLVRDWHEWQWSWRRTTGC